MVPLIGPVPDTRDSIVIMKELCLLDCFRLVLNGCDILLSHVSDPYQGHIQSRSIDEILDKTVHNWGAFDSVVVGLLRSLGGEFVVQDKTWL